MKENKRIQKISALFRNVQVLKISGQVLFVLLLVIFFMWAFSNYRQRGLTFSYSFLNQEASFDLAEGIHFEPTDTYARAFLVGLVNTVRIAVFGIIFASIIGLIAGIARLSSNWLLRMIAGVYIELIRNTPLLVQLFFIYFAVILKLPTLKNAITFPGSAILSNRGIVIPALRFSESTGIWWVFICIAIIIAVIMFIVRRWSLKKTGRPLFSILWVIVPILVIPAIGWFLSPENPIYFEIPELITKSGGVLKIEGGSNLSAEFTALLLGLVIYSGAYIAEVVRAGIQSVPKGQTEAARSQGFKSGQIMRLIVLPQALRVIIPPLISQYLNLTKNSSLAIAIGFLDLYAVSQTMLNQSGRVVEVFFMIMLSYLSISLTISLIMNYVNRKIQIIER